MRACRGTHLLLPNLLRTVPCPRITITVIYASQKTLSRLLGCKLQRRQMWIAGRPTAVQPERRRGINSEFRQRLHIRGTNNAGHFSDSNALASARRLELFKRARAAVWTGSRRPAVPGSSRGSPEFYYDTTGCEPLPRLASNRSLGNMMDRLRARLGSHI